MTLAKTNPISGSRSSAASACRRVSGAGMSAKGLDVKIGGGVETYHLQN